jgi:hypothetical protein
MNRPRSAGLLVLAAAITAMAPFAAAADQPPGGASAATTAATWHAAKGSEVRQQLQQWLASRPAAGPTVQQIETDWAAADSWTPEELLDRLAEVFASADPAAKELVTLCSHPRRGLNPSDFPWLADEATGAIERNNLRLLYGRWLVQASLYDEALVPLQSLQPDDVVDPAALLFYQSVVYHRLLKKEAGLGALLRLLEPGHEIPRRYQSVARLMQSDLAPLKDDSLDHIARRMEDIRRRLDLGRSGTQVREVEDGVIKSLDKLIEELEQQAAAAAAAAAQGGTNVVPVAPAQDSVPMGGKGPGHIVQRDIGHQSGWGDLPPHQRQEALQQIGKDFPAHYRDVIEQYFRKLATEDSKAP